jgi:hypothetical protein
VDDLDAAIALVYAQPASGFVAARGALVKELKAAKRKEEAARVAALRRPTKLAWAVGEAVRRAPDAAGSFFSAVESLGAAGGDLRQRTADLRQAVATIVKGADGVDHGEATAALLAVAADPGATEALRLGRLADVPAGGGFGGLPMGFGGPAADEAPPKPAPPEARAEPADGGGAGADQPAGGDDEAAAAEAAAARREKEARLRAERIAALEAECAEAADAEAAALGRVEAARAALDAAQADLDQATAALEEKRSAATVTAARLQEARDEPDP